MGELMERALVVRHLGSRPLLSVLWGVWFFLLPLASPSLFGDELHLVATQSEFLSQYCLDCHDGSDDNRWDLSAFQSLDASSMGKWTRVYDRIKNGEMPPPDAEQPAPETRARFQRSLYDSLDKRSRQHQQQHGRVGLRALTPVEYQHALNDLLEINLELSYMIPSGGSSNSFDTIADKQGFSPLHARKYLEAAELAIDHAIRMDPKPEHLKKRYPYKKHKLVRKNIDKDDHNTIGETDKGIVMFHSASYLFKLYDLEIVGGHYKIRAKARSFQSPGNRPVVLTLNSGDYRKGSTELLAYFDITNETRIVEADVFLRRNEYVFPGVEDLLHPDDGKNIWNVGPDTYNGSGLELEWVEIEGPFHSVWPPSSTTRLFPGQAIEKLPEVRWSHERKRHYEYAVNDGDDAKGKLKQVLLAFANRAYCRPVQEKELETLLRPGLQVLEQGRGLESAVRVSLRGLLSSPELLFFMAQPGKLDDHALATRLSFFLWKSLPDSRLREVADRGQLSNPKILRQQLERMLNDEKSNRFVNDFTNQWLRLSEIDATSPDQQLYPEYEVLLRKSMLQETRRFFKDLVEEDGSTDNLVDSEYAFLNRRLAEHYGVNNVHGEHFRRVELPEPSPRGGVMTQASILKVTANGTVTSPVRRGAWVLTHLLGTPPAPPPPNVGSIEPDTRGAKTIRELLNKHRADASCASCHNQLDPPGFALESFDVIGGYRAHYRSKKHGRRPTQKLRNRNIWEYKIGLPVDPSGVEQGESFEDIQQFKKILLKRREAVAKNLIQKLIEYSTGAEIQFADRKIVEGILDRTRESNFGVRSIIREIILSPIFLRK